MRGIFCIAKGIKREGIGAKYLYTFCNQISSTFCRKPRPILQKCAVIGFKSPFFMPACAKNDDVISLNCAKVPFLKLNILNTKSVAGRNMSHIQQQAPAH